MQRYRYKHGDRPLEGFTIQRAAGSGGFGEVYYAISDGGREVAIKAVQNYEQIELRGITQCMNLKSPHLVTIFDVKHNEHNEPFVIMEYVSGPSLRDLLLEAPEGLGAQKSAFFLREIAKGLSYLHDCGIVHRDLKPSNIFYENGYVKVGDYGLTKSISASRHSGHTITVGTVHYMAPEIGAGKYNFSIDIYSLGVLLYEMLMGDVPFVGGSPGEILMKHMTAEPELDKIEEPFSHVIKKAMAKDPDERYKSVQEMVEDLFGSENIRNSVSHFSPDDLSIVAGRIAAKVDIGDKLDSDKPTIDMTPAAVDGVEKQITGTARRFAQQVDDIGRSVANKFDAKVDKILGTKKTRIPGVTDPILPGQRHFLAFISMAIVALGAGLLVSDNDKTMILPTALTVFVMTGVCANSILYSQRRWGAHSEPQSQWISRLVTSCFASSMATIIGFVLLKVLSSRGVGIIPSNPFEGGRSIHFPFRMPFLGIDVFNNFGSVWLSMAVPMLMVDWRRIISQDRDKRLSLGSALWIGLLGAIAATIFGSSPIVIAAVLAGTSLVVQTASSFGRVQINKKDTQFNQSLASGVVPASMRSGWLAASLGALALGLFIIIYSGTELDGDKFTIGLATGVDSLILSIFFFIGSCRNRFKGWYRYLGKPALLLACILTIVTSAICMGCMNLHNGDFAISLFLIIFPAVAFFVILVIPAGVVAGSAPRPVAPPAPPAFRPPPPQLAPGVSSFKRLVALLLSSGGLFGIFGLHRFYVGKIGTGIIWFFTGGLFMIGQIIDFVMILTGQFKDRYGLPLVVWQDKEELKDNKFKAKPAMPAYAAEPKAVMTERSAQKAQAAAAAHAPKPQAPRMPTTTVIYQPFHPFAFLSSGVGFICTVLAVTIGAITGLHLPHFVAAGWLNTSLASEAEQFFGYPQWPELVLRLGTITTVVLLLLAAVFMVIGRRHLGIRHLMRAIFGLGALFFAIMLFTEGIEGYPFGKVQESLNSGQIGPAFERLLDCCTGEEAIFAAFIFLVSIIILAWPPRRNQIVTTPAPNQGVS